MNPAVATIVVAAIAAAGALVGAIVNAMLGRGGQRADIADKVSEASDRIFARMDLEIAKVEKRCKRCENELHSRDTAIDALIDAVTELLPLVPAGATETEAARAAIRTARRSRHENGSEGD